MGWRDRGWYVGEHGPALFDRSGNIGPTAWWDGRIVGGWAQRKDGEIALRLLEDAGSEASAALAAEAQRLREWIGDRQDHAAVPHPAGTRAGQPVSARRFLGINPAGREF